MLVGGREVNYFVSVNNHKNGKYIFKVLMEIYLKNRQIKLKYCNRQIHSGEVYINEI